MSAHAKSHVRHHSDGSIATLTDEISGLRDTVSTGVHDATEGGKRVLQAAGQVAAKSVGTLRDSAVKTTERAGNAISERPLTAVAVAAGVGLAIGMLLMWRRR